MEINLKQLSDQKTEATTGAKRMRLSENATSMVFQLFTKNIYSNPIGTVVREITSNCFDSHIEAKISPKVPVVIRKTKDMQTDTIYISFIDYGVGMSPDRVENIYGVYFESTKRVDNTQIGGFGIGGKTPLAYKRSTGHGQGEYDNSFYVVTIFDKTKYYYCIYEGQEAPEISLLHSEPTDEHNGTEIRIPVLERDVQSFKKEMVRQLYYFENVVFEGFGNDSDSDSYDETLMNEYTIVRGKTFFYRGDDYSNTMHVCLGRVAYPIDYNVLGLNSSDYRLPVGLKLEIGEIGVVASREQLDYSEHTIKVLKKKLEACKAEIKELLAKQYANIVSLEDYFKVKNYFGVLELGKDMSINVGNLIKQGDVDFSNFRYNFMKMPNDKQLFKFFFEVKTYGKKPSRSRYSSKYEFEGGYKELADNNNLYYITGEFIRKVVKQAFLKETHGMYHIVENRAIYESYMRSEIADLFNVHMDKLCDDNGKPVAYVQSLIDMQEEYFAIVQQYAKDYDSVEVPEDFIANRKRKKDSLSKEMRNSSIPVKFMGGYSKCTVKVDDLLNFNMPIFYGTQEDEYKLSKAHELYSALFDSDNVIHYYNDYYDRGFTNGRHSGKTKSPKGIMFIMLAKNNIKYMDYCKKAYKVEEFATRMLYRKEKLVLSYFQTYDLSTEWDKVNELYKADEFSKVSSAWAKKAKEIDTFVEALPKKDSNIGYLKAELSRYFDLSNVQQTAEQKRIARMIKEVQKLQDNNSKILRHINMPYHIETEGQEFFDILKKVMAL